VEMSVFADREWPRVDGGQQQTCAMYKPRHVCPCAFFCGCNCGGSRATSCWRPTTNISCLNQSKEWAYALLLPKRRGGKRAGLSSWGLPWSAERQAAGGSATGMKPLAPLELWGVAQQAGLDGLHVL
jgi:hypothetical protein